MPLLVSLLSFVLALLGLQAPRPAAAEVGENAFELREEFFVLEQPHGEDLTDSEVVGWAAWRRRSDEQGTTLQLEVELPSADTRVLHVERCGGFADDLVWRELHPRFGRTLRAVRNEHESNLAVVEWGGIQARRRSFDAAARFPLTYSERLRKGVEGPGSLVWFDPLAGAPVDLSVVVNAADREGRSNARSVEMRRVDGTLAVSYEFEGEALHGFRWHGGGVVARRVDSAVWDARPRSVGGSP